MVHNFPHVVSSKGVGYHPPLVHLPYIAVATNTRADIDGEEQLLKEAAFYWFSCRVAFRSAVLAAVRIWPGASRLLDFSYGLRGPSPQAITPFGWGWSPGAWGATNKGNADGAVGILGKCRACVGYGPAPGPTKKKALCHTFTFGRAWNKYRSFL